MRVVAGVILHLPGERTAGPVGFLRAFDQLDAEVLLHQGREREFRVAGQPRRDHRVEHGAGLGEPGPAHEPQVVIRAVEDQELAGEHLEKRPEIEARQRIDQDVPLIEGNLDEAELLEVAMEAVGLRIHRDGIEAVNV